MYLNCSDHQVHSQDNQEFTDPQIHSQNNQEFNKFSHDKSRKQLFRGQFEPVRCKPDIYLNRKT